MLAIDARVKSETNSTVFDDILKQVTAATEVGKFRIVYRLPRDIQLCGILHNASVRLTEIGYDVYLNDPLFGRKSLVVGWAGACKK